MIGILRFENVIERLIYKEGRYERRKLKKLSGVKLSRPEAQDVWQRILEHKWRLSQQLNRDVGMKVAAIDYFENIQSSNNELRPRRYFNDSPTPTLPMMKPLLRKG